MTTNSELVSIPEGNGVRYEMNGRPWVCAHRCRACGEYGKYADTNLCDYCEELVLALYPDVRKARGLE